MTTHAGSLPRPDELLEANRAAAQSNAAPNNEILLKSVIEVVKRQREVGLDIINDGEYGKAMTNQVDFGAWASYAFERLTGWEVGPPDSVSPVSLRRERNMFPGAYRELYPNRGASPATPLFTGPVGYKGTTRIQADLQNVKAALGGRGTENAFITAVAPGSFARRLNRYYNSDEEYLFALGAALSEEYKAIIGAGFSLQIDDPGLPDSWDLWETEPSLSEYRKYAAMTIEALNSALKGLPRDRIRYHICWGSWHGPHTTDLPLEDIVDVLLNVNAEAYSVEAGNVRHEHEWEVWSRTKLPDGKLLIPGVVSHATNLVEHPQVVANRILKYASVVGRENVIAGTDCGLGGRIHPEIAWAKLGSLVNGAEIASKKLWAK
jgi:5-methyltetrahydropteroyltriglutamate--homocysteine methyltransferase